MDIDLLAAAISEFSKLSSHPRIYEAEINPVLVSKSGIQMLDALVRLMPPKVSVPQKSIVPSEKR